jgi:hypothetical protein
LKIATSNKIFFKSNLNEYFFVNFNIIYLKQRGLIIIDLQK